jgi:hypothetical protein
MTFEIAEEGYRPRPRPSDLVCVATDVQPYREFTIVRRMLPCMKQYLAVFDRGYWRQAAWKPWKFN